MSETLKVGGEKSAESTNAKSLSEMADKFNPDIARKTQVAREVYSYSSLGGTFVSEQGMGHLLDYRGGAGEMAKVKAMTKGSAYADLLEIKRGGDLTIGDHTTRLLETFDDTFMEPLHNAGVDHVSVIAREALKVRDIYRFIGPSEAIGFMRDVDKINPSAGRSYVIDVLSGEKLARAAFAEDADARKKDEFRAWGAEIDQKYGVSGHGNSPTANLAKMIADTVTMESQSRKKN